MILFKRNIINSCDKCKLNMFIDCVVRSDYSGLGKGTKKQLLKAWNDIYNEYLKLSKNEAHLRVFQLYKEIGLLNSKFLAVQTSISILAFRYSKRIVNDLKKLGFNYEFPKNDKQKLLQQLRKCETISKGFILEAQLKQKELQKLLDEQAKEPLTEADFDKLLIQLGKFQGYRIDKNIISVSEFVQLTNIMNKELTQRKLEYEKLKTK